MRSGPIMLLRRSSFLLPYGFPSNYEMLNVVNEISLTIWDDEIEIILIRQIT